MHLEEWEKRFKPYLEKVELLAEIPLTRTEHAELEKALNTFIRKHGITQATRCLKQEYPSAFAVYLAFKAAFNEDRGFWKQVASAIGLEDESPLFHPMHHWGKTFLEIIETHPNLRRFHGISEQPYITPIRLHGCIPSYSLNDFFKHILLPSVQHQRYCALDDEAALEGLLEHYTVVSYVDDVVRYFFKYGGKYSFRFFQQCRQMARLAERGEPLPTAEQLGLRPYILQAFESYLQNPPEPAKWRRLPRLFFKPYEPAFRLLLPAQPVTLEEANILHVWHICGFKEGVERFSENIETEVRRKGQEWQTEEKECHFSEPFDYVQVRLVCYGREEKTLLSRSVPLPPVSGRAPLRAFRYDNEASYPVTDTLGALTLWLFYPRDIRLHFEGEGRQVEMLHPFAPPWEEWQSQAWDLKKVRRIRFFRGDEEVCLPISVSAPYEPKLEGQEVHPQSIPVEEKPLFLGAPKLRLPLRDTSHPETELNDWHLTLESHYAARPEGEWEGRANQLPYEIQSEDNCALLDLTHWLTKEPRGTYHLRAHGPGRGEEVELPFRVWHQIRIEGLSPYYLPSSKGSEKACFLVELPADCQLTASEERVSVTKLPHGWQVCADADASQALLALEYLQQPEAVRVPLCLFIPRLRWALQLDVSSALQWHTSPLRLSLAQLLQSHAPRLRVELPLKEAKALQTALRLKNPEKPEPLQSETLEITNTRHSVEIRLDRFFDTLRQNIQMAVFDFVLELYDDFSDSLASLLVLRVTQELDVHCCYFEWLEGGNWRVHWLEPKPLRHRRLRLWSLWQPWAEPIEIRLPDEAPRGDHPDWWCADIPHEIGLPPAWYRVQFLAAAPDDTPPLPNDPPENSIEVKLIEPQERLKQIRKALADHPSIAFALHAERACLYDTQKRIPERDEEIKWCVSNWHEGSLLHLYGFQRWLASRDPVSRQALLMHMFRRENLEKLRFHRKDFVGKYLALAPEVQNIKPESARLILELANGGVVALKAMQVLIKERDPQIVGYIWKEIQEGRLSEADAAQALSIEPAFAKDELLRREDVPLRSRLLLALSRHSPLPDMIIHVGYWVYSEAGWGKIVEIKGATYPEGFFVDKEQPCLVLALWDSSTIIEIDLKTRQIIMKGKEAAYRCKCRRFIATRDEGHLEAWKHHGEVCPYANEPFPIPFPHEMEEEVKYSPTAPESVYGKWSNNFPGFEQE